MNNPLKRYTGKHAGTYLRTGTAPASLSLRNAFSWQMVTGALEIEDTLSYEVLCSLTRDHDAPGGGQGFINYCLRQGWLVVCGIGDRRLADQYREPPAHWQNAADNDAMAGQDDE